MTSRTTATTGGVIRWVVGVILVGHGLIHLIGPLEIWDLADLPEMIGRPSVDPGAAATNLFESCGWRRWCSSLPPAWL